MKQKRLLLGNTPQATITDFSHSFAELEGEYTRLQSEGDVAQEIGRILQKIEPD